MSDDPRFRMLGKYRTPRFKYGAIVSDTLRGDVVIVGLSDAPIPWPIGKKGRAKSFILYGDLERAVRRESNIAIQHWWNVCPNCVWRWRKALEVELTNEGTLQRRRELILPRGDAMRALIPYTPERNKKIADAKRGVKRSRRTVQKMRRAMLGKQASDEARRKMSESHKRLGTRPPWLNRPWTPAEDALLTQHIARIVAEKTGRTVKAVYSRRRVLGLPDGRPCGALRWKMPPSR